MRRRLARIITISIATLVACVAFSQVAFAATPVPPQCIMNLSGLGGGSANGAVQCNLTGDATNFQAGKCYSLDQVPATEIDCTKPPLNNLWRFTCEGSDTVFQAYIVADPNNPNTTSPNNDPVKQCADAGLTYKAAGVGTVTPTAPNQNGTPPAAATPNVTAASGSGATTANEKTKVPEGTLNELKITTNTGKFQCGGGKPEDVVMVSINLGCKGQGAPILDLMFAIIRLLSTGVGVVIVASMVVAGIQYTASRGNPQEVEKAQERIRSNIIALLIFIFTFAILNWLIPAKLLHI